MTTRRQTNNDFDPADFTKKTDEHDKLLNDLHKRVGTNEYFGKSFAQAAQDSKSLEQAVEKVVIRLLQSNTDTQNAVEDIVGKIDGRIMKRNLTGLAKVVIWVASIIIAALVGAFINSKIK